MTSEKPERIWAGQIADQTVIGYATRVWGDDPRVGTDEPATKYIRHNLHLAAVAEAYEVAAETAKGEGEGEFFNPVRAIRDLTPADAIAAREARDRQVREEALREAAAKAEWVSDAGVDDPVGHYRDGYADGAGMAEQAILALIEGETDE